jgi:preprotein translocase subunit YajC
MKKKILITILLFIIIGISVYFYAYQDHRDINTETADYIVTVSGLEKDFASNDSLSYIKYQDKTIELTAQVSSIDTSNKSIVLGEKIFATFKDSLPKDIVAGKTLKIKGRFLGYDELLQEFKIDQSSIVR